MAEKREDECIVYIVYKHTIWAEDEVAEVQMEELLLQM